MNRKLSATQILHGARAYSHNASRRAHQLSGPKRVRVMHGPVGDAALNDGIDSPCQHCGYQLCNCEPCATCGEVPYYCSGTHAYEPPKPSARALDSLPAEPARAWRVGDRVRVVGAPFDGRVGAVSQITRFATFVVHLDGPKEGTQEYYHSADGSDLVAEPSPAGGRFKVGDSVQLRRHSMGETCFVGQRGVIKILDTDFTAKVSGLRSSDDSLVEQWVALDDLEPAPSPVSEVPAGESDEAVLKRCGFSALTSTRVGDGRYAGHRVLIGQSEIRERAGQWFVNYPDIGKPNTYAPSALQAACAALGIGLRTVADGTWRADINEDLLTIAKGADAESVARAALEAWSRREPAQ